ncbi:MAG TPA: hypothetical protein PKG67_04465 [Turneriella sp.]|nr:hypothetical protein [Turneriella sp.]HNM99681.1 hypothetical protein [Turneriella sp.]
MDKKRFTTINIMKFTCRIKIIFVVLLMSSVPLWASDWETGLTGAWSVASRQLTASTAYTAGSEDSRFIDFGGRVAHRLGPGFLGVHFGLYSSFGLREQVTASNAHATDFVVNKSAETGLPVSFDSGTYRLALGWNALQLRYRYYLTEYLFAEAGAGAAYGFGGIEAAFKGSNSAGSVSSTYYHRYSEWGFISSASAGISLPLGDTIRLEAACEFAWLWAQIREPNIFRTGDFTLSQTFFRPMVGIVLKF